jgi:antibiotic biosynthesis monooxygenase (ABM) superfamily enzyme
MSVMRPLAGSGSREYGILQRFRDVKCRDIFMQPHFKQWEATEASLIEVGARHPHQSNLETWFILPTQEDVILPPRLKMAIVTILGVWPASILVPLVLNPLISGFHCFFKRCSSL